MNSPCIKLNFIALRHQTFSPTRSHPTRHLVSFISFNYIHNYISLLLEHRFALGERKRKKKTITPTRITARVISKVIIKPKYHGEKKKTFEHGVKGREISPTRMGKPRTMLCINFNFIVLRRQCFNPTPRRPTRHLFIFISFHFLPNYKSVFHEHIFALGS